MSEVKNYLAEGLKKIGLNSSVEQLNLFERFMDLLLEWNEKLNLTAITQTEEIIIKHFLDSLMFLLYESRYNFSLNKTLDLGTGAGFPGIPIKIMRPEIEIVLADSLNKRISYLNNIIEELQFTGICTLHSRAEEMGRDLNYRESFDTVLSRAVANMVVLAEYCLPLVKVGGFMIALKGPGIDEEINEAKRAVEILGGEVSGIEKINLPFIEDKRSIVFIKKIQPTPKKYPRKPGTPKKSPLK